MAVDSDAPSISRSNSGINLDDSMSVLQMERQKGRERIRGREKEVDIGID